MCRVLGIDVGDLPIEFRDVEVAFTVEYVEALEALLRASPRVLVVIDTYGAMLPAGIDYNTPEFAHWLRELGKLSRALSVVIVVLIHEKKTDGGKAKGSGLEMISGSFSAAGAMQAVISLRPTGDDNTDPIAVTCSRAPEESFLPFAVCWEDVADPDPAGKYAAASREARLWGLQPVEVKAPAGEVATPVADAKALAYGRLVIERLGQIPSATQTHLIREVDGGTRNLKLAVLQRLTEEGVLSRYVSSEAGPRGGPKAHTLYSLAPRSKSNTDAFMRWGT